MSPFPRKLTNQYSTKSMELPVCSDEEQLHEEEQKSHEEKFRETENIKAYVAGQAQISYLINLGSDKFGRQEHAECLKLRKESKCLVKALGGIEKVHILLPDGWEIAHC